MSEITGFSLITHLIFLAAGAVIGHRFAIIRDRRREFNEIADPIRVVLLKELKNPSPYAAGITYIDADRLKSVLPFWSRRGFAKTLERYEQAKEEEYHVNEYGEVGYSNRIRIVTNIEALLRYVVRK